MLPSFTIDKSCQNVGFNNSAILLKTIVDFSEGTRSIVEEPASLGKKDLSLSQACILFSHILEELDSFNEMLWRSS